MIRIIVFNIINYLFSLLFFFSPPVLGMAMRVAGAGKKAGAALGGAVAGAELVLLEVGLALAGSALLLVVGLALLLVLGLALAVMNGLH